MNSFKLCCIERSDALRRLATSYMHQQKKDLRPPCASHAPWLSAGPFFLIPCAQQRFSYSGCARWPPVQPNQGGIQPVHSEDILGPRSTRRALMNYPCWESAPWATIISSSDILYHHLNSRHCRPRSPEDTAY